MTGDGCHRERSAAIQRRAVIASTARRSSGLKRHLIKGILDRSIWIAASASPVVRLTGLLRCARNDGVAVIASAARRSSGSKRHLIKGILDRSIWIAASASPVVRLTGLLRCARNDGGVAVIASGARRSSGSKRHLIKGILDRSIWIAASASPVV